MLPGKQNPTPRNIAWKTFELDADLHPGGDPQNGQ